MHILLERKKTRALLTVCRKGCNKTCTYNQERLGTIEAEYRSCVYGVTFMGNRTEYWKTYYTYQGQGVRGRVARLILT